MDLKTLGIGFGIFLGAVGGFALSVGILDQYYRNVARVKIDAMAKRYVYMLNCFGIKKGADGVWRMHPYDRDEIWVKKE